MSNRWYANAEHTRWVNLNQFSEISINSRGEIVGKRPDGSKMTIDKDVHNAAGRLDGAIDGYTYVERN